MMCTLDASRTVEMLNATADRIIAAKDILTEADKMGDADHGIGMARGFEALKVKLAEGNPGSPYEALRLAGLTLMSAIGGASGAIFGTLYLKGADAVQHTERLGAEDLAVFYKAGLEAVKARGGATLGDKTVVDALEPAVNAAISGARREADLEEISRIMAAEARKGAEGTRNFRARVGKMKTLGDRSLGYLDPGALSTAIMFEAACDFIAEFYEGR